MKTREEIEHLKRDWKRDRLYDLEGAEGFEDHREELLQYRLDVERKENEALIVKWERVEAYQRPRAWTTYIWRFEVPTGWVVDIDGQINFIPDPDHRWHIYQDLDKGV